MHKLVQDIAGCLGASRDEQLRSPASLPDLPAGWRGIGMNIALQADDKGLRDPRAKSSVTETLEQQVGAVLRGYQLDVAERELSRRLQSAGYHDAAALATYYKREVGAAFLPARHLTDNDLLSTPHALVDAVGTITVKGHTNGLPVADARFESSVPQQFSLDPSSKYDVYSRVTTACGSISIDNFGEVRRTDALEVSRPGCLTVHVDLLPGLTEVTPPKCSLLFAERKHFAGRHRETVRNILVDLLTGGHDSSSVCASLLAGHGACFTSTTSWDTVGICGEDIDLAVHRYGTEFVRGIAAIEGPPGTGKTYTLARIVQAMRSRGLTVAVTAPSHRVLQSMESTLEAFSVDTYRISPQTKTTLKRGLKAGAVVLGTTHQFCKPEARHQFDFLLVDEAGQLSFADVLASAHASKDGLLLAGDTKQLPHIARCIHGGYADQSGLEQAVGSIPAGSSMMLTETRRMCPPITAFVSKNFYSGKLRCNSSLKLGRQLVIGSNRFSGNGIRTVICDVADAPTQSQVQRDVVVSIVHELLDDVAHANSEGTLQKVRAQDVLIITPYNAQVNSIKQLLKTNGTHGVEVGTVNKLQGREAAIVIFSMSSTQDFAAEAWRVNVAVSRAKTLAIVVACKEGHEILKAKYKLHKYSTTIDA